ncbi:ATP-dependent RNA helicase DbpA [Methylophaga thiooxydans]|uniref:DbpA RNA binding domain family n=1 Tax=Methylophaga thiooxydans DMS010 TaxID=637616 RepID=C0N7I1_9GAMM|nr:ATP-dependent RNA helicase DbpA [Methylophaga thiooxydans]EEF79148.1 DbpA RNA binding domain family [Methylophaga thiooxydans DMS010]
MANDSFRSLQLSKAQLDALDSLGYESMTAIQAQSLPEILKGNDLIAQAKTGSGKTAAFGIGLLQKLNPRFFGAQALVLCPTRELAEQVGKEIRKLARFMPNIKLVMLCGGKPIGPQIGSLEHGAHIVVGTPGRVQDHLRKNTLKLDGLTTLVLDEADRMLDMGFADAMQAIIGQTPKNRQTLLFSATYPDTIQHMSRQIQRNPVTVTVEAEHNKEVIQQVFYEVSKHDRNTALLSLFAHYQPETCVVFCHTKKQCDDVADFLNNEQIDALAIHGDLDQRDRDQVLVRFANNSCPVLVATDVAARGLDIKALQMVINYELPRDPEVYVHRIGRTGRAGQTGLAMSIVTPNETPRILAIEEYSNRPCPCDELTLLNNNVDFSLQAPMATIQIDAGRKGKLRPGDILGALTGDAGLKGSQIGKIDIFDMSSYVAIEKSAIRQALSYFSQGKIKGRNVRARKLK